MSLKLYSPIGNPHANAITITAKLASVKVEHINTDLKTVREKDFKKRNPHQKIPVLETPEGHVYETNAILRHIARIGQTPTLLGSSQYEHAIVDQWLDALKTEFEPPLIALVGPIFGFLPPDAERSKQARSELQKLFTILNEQLGKTSHLTGGHQTIADIAYVSLLAMAFRVVFDEKFRKQFPNVIKWYELVAHEKTFQSIYGKVRYVANEWPAFGEGESAKPSKPKDDKKKEEKKKEEKKKEDKPQQEKPKDKGEQKKQPAKKKEKDEQDEEEDTPVEPKKDKNPLDALPESKFKLYDFKTMFVNEKDKKKAVEAFLQQFDAEGFSVWKIHYLKTDEDGKKLFLMNNLKNGFIQRLDHFRKYGFGVLGVYGEEPELEIRGVLLWRGTEIPTEIKELDQYESFSFNKLDVSKDNDRKLLREYWEGVNDNEGQESVVQGLRAKDISYFK